MTSKELRRLSRRELLQMLLAQCEETERLEQELGELTEAHETMSESYERLKAKLNVKDERLNAKDAQIAELRDVIEQMKASRMIELEEAGNIAEAALRLNGVFEAAQRAAEQYLLNVRRIGEISMDVLELPEEDKKIPIESGWRAGVRRRGTGTRLRTMTLAEPGRAEEDSGGEEPGIEGGGYRRIFATVSGDFHG